VLELVLVLVSLCRPVLVHDVIKVVGRVRARVQISIPVRPALVRIGRGVSATARGQQLNETDSRSRGVLGEVSYSCYDGSARAPPIVPRAKTADVSKMRLRTNNLNNLIVWFRFGLRCCDVT
jgi:hypothetical protein